MESNISFSKKDLMLGVDTVVDAVKGTLGASGYNALIGSLSKPYHFITNDGKTIAFSTLFPKNKIAQMGVDLMRELADKLKDGTTTAMTLTQAILHEGLKVNESPMDIKESLDECLKEINTKLEARKIEITPQDIHLVANTSGENEQIANLLSEIYQELGSEAIVSIEGSNSLETYYEIGQGVRLNYGYAHPFMANDKTQAIYKNPKFLLLKNKITSSNDILPALEWAIGSKEPLVIATSEIDNKVLGNLVANYQMGKLKVLVIKVISDFWFRDLAEMTGATIISQETGVSMLNFIPNYLGTCEKIVAGEKETELIGIKDISEYIKTIDEEDHKTLLSTKTAILKIGAGSETELTYKKMKAENARNSSQLALRDGVIEGGGVTLYQISKQLPDTIGGKILKKALQAPLKQIIINSGYTPRNYPFFGKSINLNNIENKGWNSKTKEVSLMFEDGILDSLTVTKESVKGAISLAGTILTIKPIIPLDIGE